MKKVSQTNQFSRDIKRIRKQRKDLGKLKTLVKKLAKGESLDAKHRDHRLIGSWHNCRECHVQSDWILIYSTDPHTLRLERTGSHSDLFKK